MKPKRGKFAGFHSSTTPSRIKLMRKNAPAGNWRKFDTIRLQSSILTRKWVCGEEEVLEKYICPQGMVKFLKKLLENGRCKNWQALPEKVVDNFLLTKETYDKESIKLTITDDGGSNDYEDFNYIYCSICRTQNLPHCLQKYKKYLPFNPTHIDLINCWDKIEGVEPKDVDLCGCVLPNQLDVNASPNARRYIVRPTEHAKKFHDASTFAAGCSSSSGGSSSSSGSLHSVGSGGSQMVLGPVDNATGGKLSLKRKSSSDKGTTPTVVVKFNKKLKMAPIGTLLDPKITISSASEDDLDSWAKDFCMTTVLTGANKMVSNASSINFYDAVMDGVRKYHATVLKNVIVDGKTLAPPPKVTLNGHNIASVQRALLEGYKSIETDSNPYKVLRDNENYSLMHDGIQKFSRELNGVFLRSVDSGYNVVNTPWTLTEIQGGSLNRSKLADHILTTVATVHPVKCNATTEFYTEAVKQNVQDCDLIPKPPSYFSCCELELVDFSLKKIQLLFKNWPVAVVGDGCSTNNAAMVDLVNNIGLLTPSARCTSHAADGSIKRMTNSATYCVDEVKEFVATFRVILRHFKLSGKSTCLLNDALAVLEMKKVHLMTFCPTRMSYTLTAAKQVVGMLVALCDVLVSADLKEEERSSFMTPKSMIILHLLADVESIFVKYFLRSLDTDNALIMEAYNTSIAMVSRLQEFQSPLTDKFVGSLTEDDNGNIHSKFVTVNGSHDIILNYPHKPRRGDTSSKIDVIKAETISLKDKIIQNLISNIEDQCQSGTIVEFASLFDLKHQISLDERVSLLKKLHKIYCMPYTHVVVDDSDYFNDFEISVRYEPKIPCSFEELVKEFKSLWPIFNQNWRKFSNVPEKERLKKFYDHILNMYSITHPKVCDMILLLYSITASTGPLERAYSKLAKITYKDRNKMFTSTMEVLWILSVLNIKHNEPNIDIILEKAKEYCVDKKIR